MGVARRQNARSRATANAARARGLSGAIRHGAREITIRGDARADMSDNRRRIAADRARRVGRRDGGVWPRSAAERRTKTRSAVPPKLRFSRICTDSDVPKTPRARLGPPADAAVRARQLNVLNLCLRGQDREAARVV